MKIYDAEEWCRVFMPYFSLVLLFTISLIVADNIEYIQVLLNNDYPSITKELDDLWQNKSYYIQSTVDDSEITVVLPFSQKKYNLSDFYLMDGTDVSGTLIGRLDTFPTAVISTGSRNLNVYHKTEDHTASGTEIYSAKLFFTILPSSVTFQQVAFNFNNLVDFQNCNDNNIFANPFPMLSISANDKGPCEMFILPDMKDIPNVLIQSLETNSDKIILKSVRNNKVLQEIQNSDVSLWKNNYIYSDGISIVIFPGSQITVNLKTGKTSSINYEGGIQKGIMASPSYSIIVGTSNVSQQLYIIATSEVITVELKVKELNGNLQVLLDDEPNKLSLKSNETYNFGIKFSLSLYYAQEKDGNNFFTEYVLSPGLPTTTTSRTTIKFENRTTLRDVTVTSTSEIFTSSESGISPLKKSSPILFIISGITVFMIVILIVGLFFLRRWYLTRKATRFFQRILDNALKTNNNYVKPSKILEEINRINHKDLLVDFTTVLGTGSSSWVYKAILTNPQKCEVAVKIPTAKLTAEEAAMFGIELQTLISIPPHSSILQFFGWSMINNVMGIVTELAEGDLLTHVRNIQPERLPTKDALKVFIQIVSALGHLASNGIIHRDVACRNILLFPKNIVKLSDFGLCCQSDAPNLTYAEKRFPLRWLSLEALKDQAFSDKSDVWAFGILCYEVFTFGDLPYKDIPNNELLPFLEEGKRLKQPDDCPEALGELMMTCWEAEPSDRPTFVELYKILRALLEAETAHYGYLELYDDLT